MRGLLRARAARLPPTRPTTPGEEARAGARVLGEQFARAVAVVADGRGVEEHGRRLPRLAHGVGEGARRRDARVEDLAAVALRPRQARERGAGEVHDRVDALHHGEVDDARRRRPRRPRRAPCARRRTRRTTSCPSAVRRSTSAVPMNPDAPATSTRMGQASSASIVIGMPASACEIGQLTFASSANASNSLLGDARHAGAHEQVAAEHALARLEGHRGRGLDALGRVCRPARGRARAPSRSTTECAAASSSSGLVVFATPSERAFPVHGEVGEPRGVEARRCPILRRACPSRRWSIHS